MTLSASPTPQLPILNLNTLSKYSYNNNNLAVALSAIFVMELVSA
jgi:hypothetical protein